MSDSPRLLRSTLVVGVATLVSRILGFLRDVVLARLFGAGPQTDAFFVALKIPNFLRRLFAEGAFANAFVPVLAEYRAQDDPAEVRRLVAHIAGTFGAILLLVTTVGVSAAPLLVLLFAPGFAGNADQAALAGSLLRITFPYLFFVALTAFAGAILNSHGRFAVPAITPVLLNLSLISAALWLAPALDPPVLALAWGVFLAGLLQLGFQLPFLWQLKLLPRPRLAGRLGFDHPGVRKVMRLMVPALFGTSVVQINLLVDTIIASFLAAGSVTWLYYGDRLVEFPLGVFGIALATVILPRLSSEHATRDPGGFSATLDWALGLVALIALPASVGLGVLAGPIIATLFQSGAFTVDDARMAAAALGAYSVGLTGFILVKVLAPGYYARQDTATPVRIGIIAALSNIVLNLLLVVLLLRTGWLPPHAGLALATGLAAWINAGLLYRGLRTQAVLLHGRGIAGKVTKIALATTIMGGLLVVLTPSLAAWSQLPAWPRMVTLGELLLAGIVVYAAALLALGLRPRDFLRRPSAPDAPG